MPDRHADPVRAAAAWLEWYAAMGVDAVLEPEPFSHLAPPPPEPAELARALEQAARAPEAAPATAETVAGPRRPAAAEPPPDLQPAPSPAERAGPSPALQPGAASVQSARARAAACRTLTELESALASFEGCALRETATKLCFADGATDARLMLIGEAPGAEEDRQGKPFVGPSGQLLDRMLATIGLDRSRVYITNVLYWRPPGNRPPTANEVAICQAFLERQIAILSPRLVVFLGGTAARALLGIHEGVTKLRGREFVLEIADHEPLPAFVTLHPAYLLRQPLQKKFAWRDLLSLRTRLRELEISPTG